MPTFEVVARTVSSTTGRTNVAGSYGPTLIAVYWRWRDSVWLARSTPRLRETGDDLHLSAAARVAFACPGLASRAAALGLHHCGLIFSVIGLTIPTLFDYTERGLFATPNPGALDERLSLGASVALILVYAGNLIYWLSEGIFPSIR